MPEVTRRTLLAFVAVASVVEPTFAEAEGTSPELRALIAIHEAAYDALHRVVHRASSSCHDRMRADQVEEQALLAICSYPAIGRGDRRAKAEYLLTVEARGALDLEEQMSGFTQQGRLGFSSLLGKSQARCERLPWSTTLASERPIRAGCGPSFSVVPLELSRFTSSERRAEIDP